MNQTCLTIYRETATPPVEPQRVEPPRDTCWRFLTSESRKDELTLDVGCGHGDLMVELERLGAKTIGIETEPDLVALSREKGLDVRLGFAEQLPFPDATFSRIVCSVVIPYTDECKAVAEWSRVLKPGGRVFATYHGFGYGLRYMVLGGGIKRRFYGLRMIWNTLFYRFTGRRLPSFLGDTLCQLSGALSSYYKRSGLKLDRQVVAGSFLGCPVFLCHQLTKTPSGDVV